MHLLKCTLKQNFSLCAVIKSNLNGYEPLASSLQTKMSVIREPFGWNMLNVLFTATKKTFFKWDKREIFVLFCFACMLFVVVKCSIWIFSIQTSTHTLKCARITNVHRVTKNMLSVILVGHVQMNCKCWTLNDN